MKTQEIKLIAIFINNATFLYNNEEELFINHPKAKRKSYDEDFVVELTEKEKLQIINNSNVIENGYVYIKTIKLNVEDNFVTLAEPIEIYSI